MNSKMSLSKNYNIKYYEQNVNGALKESSLLNIMQDIATLSAESLGFGPSFVFANNYAWVVLKYHIKLYKPLTNLENITIKTEARGTSKLYAFRDFEFYSPQNDILGKACSAWSLIDMTSRKMLPMQKVLDFVPQFEKRENDLDYGKIEFINTNILESFEKDFSVRFDDIDVNKHANNCNYMIWALEALPNDFRLNYAPDIIDIKFRKEVGLGGAIKSIAQIFEENEQKTSIHVIKDNQNKEELASLKIAWKELK